MCGEQYYKIAFPSLCLVLCFLIAGCSSAPRLPPFPVKQAESYQHFLVAESLQISVEPLFDSQQNITYFGTNLIEEKILPVFVLVNNLHAKESLVIFNDKIFLRGLDNNHVNANDKLKAADMKQAMNLSESSAGIGSVPLMLAALSQISQSAEIRRNFKSKALQTNTLSAGEQCQGFVYFRLPEIITHDANPTISIEVLNLQEETSRTYQVPIKLKGEKE
ncbi:MAG: hypothetical protein ABW104_06905 [Candidatus Thiodiazotropha sp. 6PLUC2]